MSHPSACGCHVCRMDSTDSKLSTVETKLNTTSSKLDNTSSKLSTVETYLGGGSGTSVNFTGSIVDLIRSESRAQAQAAILERYKELTSPAIGHVYIQFRGQDEPASLYKGTVWTNVSSNYAGRFFRAEGTVTCKYLDGIISYISYSNSASQFNTEDNDGLQNASLPNITGNVGVQGCDAYPDYASGAFSTVATGTIDDGYSTSGHYLNQFGFNANRSNKVYGHISKGNTSATLPIPPNETFRIWKRTA